MTFLMRNNGGAHCYSVLPDDVETADVPLASQQKPSIPTAAQAAIEKREQKSQEQKPSEEGAAAHSSSILLRCRVLTGR